MKRRNQEGRKAAYIQITRKCNSNCVFCSNPSFDKELTKEQLEKRILFYRKGGVNEIFLTGGEPTVSRLLPHAIETTIKNEIEPKIITNGVKLSDLKYIKHLKEKGLEDIYLSLHSHIEKDSDRLTRRRGHFKKTIKGLENALKLDLRVNINSTINSVNASYLSDFTGFIVDKYSEIIHFVLNNLDPGNADTRNISRAWHNKWVIARLTDFELELSRTARLLMDNSKTLRIERVPLCYMAGFEEASTDTRRIVKDEPYICFFIEKGKKDLLVNIGSQLERRVKAECCRSCRLNPICGGLNLEYSKIFGTDELFPVFTDPKDIIEKINA